MNLSLSNFQVHMEPKKFTRRWYAYSEQYVEPAQSLPWNLPQDLPAICPEPVTVLLFFPGTSREPSLQPSRKPGARPSPMLKLFTDPSLGKIARHKTTTASEIITLRFWGQHIPSFIKRFLDIVNIHQCTCYPPSTIVTMDKYLGPGPWPNLHFCHWCWPGQMRLILGSNLESRSCNETRQL